MNEYENQNTDINVEPKEEPAANAAPATHEEPAPQVAPATTTNTSANTYYYTQTSANNVYADGGDGFERPVKPKTDGFGIASFCVALSFVFIGCCCCCCIPDLIFVFPILAFLAEIVALVFACVSRKKMGRFTGLAIAGLVISIIMIALYLAIVIVVVVFLLANPSFLYDLSIITESQTAYVDFFQKYAPEFYAENKEMIDEMFKEAFVEASGAVQ